MRIVLTSLYAEKYPATGESHALSVLAGNIRPLLEATDDSLLVLDMVAFGADMSERVVTMCSELQPQVIGLSVTYGTFTSLKELVPRLRSAAPTAVMTYGGPLASYLARDILEQIDDKGVVFVGESERDYAEFIAKGANRALLSGASNVVYVDELTSSIVTTPRRLANVADVAAPDRIHLKDFVGSGIQFYTEASRACSWSHCTFCLRGLLDIQGRPTEYRAFPRSRVASDLFSLASMGVETVTFADEDFLGQTIAHAEAITTVIEQSQSECGSALSFDASMTVHSIFSDHMSDAERIAKENCLSRLRTCGLRKVFLGVESGAPRQLKRFAKGHSRNEAAAAIQVLQRHDIAVELGWIMFDPLCDLGDIEANIDFLISTGTVDLTSYSFNELRLQRGTHFVDLLQTHEKKTGQNLLIDEFDHDTLSYPYSYANADVQRLVDLVRSWAEEIRPLHYPMKNFTRYGVSGPLAAHASKVKELLSRYRMGMCQSLLAAVNACRDDRGIDTAAISRLSLEIASEIVEWSEGLPQFAVENQLVRLIVGNARKKLGIT